MSIARAARWMVLGLVFVGCAPQARLDPVRPARAPGLAQGRLVAFADDLIAMNARGVTVAAEVDEWPGSPWVRDHVTPLRVTIVNRSDRPLRITYDQFALVSPAGRRYSALPPFLISGSITRPVVVDADPIYDPLWSGTGFGVSPAYAGVYPGWTVAPGPFVTDPYYYDSYYTYWTEQQLPTPTMRRLALPEGVLEPGGEVTGFLYFERVPSGARAVSFRTELVDADDSQRFGAIAIPFRVRGG